MSKKYLLENTSAEAIFLYSLFKTLFERNISPSKKPVSKNRLIKMSSSLTYAAKQRITEKNADYYLKRNRHMVYSSIPYINRLDISNDCLESIYKKMATCELYLYDRY